MIVQQRLVESALYLKNAAGTFYVGLYTTPMPMHGCRTGSIGVQRSLGGMMAAAVIGFRLHVVCRGRDV